MTESIARPPAETAGAEDTEFPYRYDARLANEIELRWQSRWAARGTFNSPNPAGPLSEGFERFAGSRKFYVMDMFPYPSGAGLHVGHPLGYIGTDVFARFLRMTGHHVLHPFGYDAFGLPAEQYAIDTGQHPRATTEANIANMRRQLRRLGLAHDAAREIATTDVSYYRWTQWIFLKIFNSWYDDRARRARPIEDLVAEFESGRRQPVGRSNPEERQWAELTEVERRRVVDDHRLAYLSEEQVNWCPGLGTVLANEEVTADGRSDIGNYPVYRRPLRQWMLRITAYAERLIEDLGMLDWTESIKQMQRNWIGASGGGNIDFAVVGAPDIRMRVFTTRPDTVPGATYMVLAPEHPLLEEIVADEWPADTPQSWRYPEGAGEAPDADRSTPRAALRAYREMASRLSDRQRTADVRTKTGVFTGSYMTNPATGESIPVFVADYVLMGYGTGAIMAVPAHDERDLEFAQKFGLPVRPVLQPPAEWFAERVLPPDTPAEKWPEAFVGDGRYRDVDGSSLSLAGVDNKTQGIEATIRWLEENGCGSRARSYRLRDWLFSRQRYWGEPFPIVYDEHGLPIALPEDMLPVTLPEMADFRPQPQDDGTSEPVPPLARAGDWTEAELDLGDGPKSYRRELNTMPQWAGSCWYYLRYLDPTNSDVLVDPEVERYWMVPEGAAEGEGGVDLYVGGVEHAVLHLLYSRFWHKVLYDLGYVSTKEPFKRLYNQGYILADAFLDARGMYVSAAEVVTEGDRHLFQGQPVTAREGKMGKSLKNAVSPDEIYASYGADTLRLYEMSMGPLDADRPWRTDDIVGVYRFLQRLWRNLVDERTGQLLAGDGPLDEETARRLHRTIAVVRKDFGNMRFNTAVARLIELNNHAAKLVAREGELPRGLAEPMVLMVAPLAPHVAEELWSRLGHDESLAYTAFPEADSELAAERTVVLPVQVNGKTRFRIEVPAGAGEDEITTLVQGAEDYARYTDGRAVQRVIVVPDRIVNLVTT
ncbi:MAG: leucine--tRNA ligase [Streptosporangiales bacterium]|nr:leucine--tRNA ligase [Streptosporangiales bacterium]